MKTHVSITPVPFPAQCGIATLYQSPQLADAFAASLPHDASGDPEVLARFVLSSQPWWARKLMRTRDLVVARLGLKTAAKLIRTANGTGIRRVGIFRIYSVSESEIILGEDDSHLDFRISLTCSHGAAPESKRVLTVATVVHCHNWLGRAYIVAISPFHRMVVKGCLRRAALTGWPAGESRITALDQHA
jgi:hypothetical protein